MSEYRLEKLPTEVILFLADGLALEGLVYLAPFAHGHDGGQTFLELLRETERFLPFRDKDGVFRLINKEAITHARYQPNPQEGAPAWLGERATARLYFFGGETLEGSIALEMPEGRTRLNDFINAAPAFFPLESGQTHYIVNSRQIHQVVQLG